MKPTTVKDLIKELIEFDPEAKVEFEAEIIHEGFTQNVDGMEYTGASERLGSVNLSIRGYRSS